MNIKNKISLTLIATLFSYGAFASGCPTDQVGPYTGEPVLTTSPNVKVKLIKSQNLEQQAIQAKNWEMRARTITMPPGSQIAMHSHDDRPETASILSGHMTMFEKNCKVPIKLEKGVIIQNGRGDTHWVKNTSNDVAVMYIVDLAKDDNFPH